MTIKKKFFYTFIILCLLLSLLNTYCFAASKPKMVKTIENAFSTIESWIITISTPATAVAVATGLFMQKFSFGEEDRIRTGKKLVRSSLFCYAFILGIDFVLAAIKTLIK